MYIFLATLSGVFASNLTLFLCIRFIQGFTAGGIIVIAKAFAGDRYEGDLLAKFLASLMVVNGIVTIIMPLRWTIINTWIIENCIHYPNIYKSICTIRRRYNDAKDT